MGRAKYPQGASPFGVMDLVGNVWQYTTEFRDQHTRAVILRGGSNYYPLVPNEWYKCGTPISFGDPQRRLGGIGPGCVPWSHSLADYPNCWNHGHVWVWGLHGAQSAKLYK